MQNLALVVAAGLVATLADWCFKRWSIESGPGLFATGLAVYVISMAFFGWSLKTGKLLQNGAGMVIVNAVGVAALSLLVFHETLTRSQWLGIGLGVVALVLLRDV